MGKVRNLLFGMIILIITDSMREINILMMNQRFIVFQIILENFLVLYQVCINLSLLRSK